MADKRPLCKLCKERHWLSGPHALHLRVPELDVPGETSGTIVTVWEPPRRKPTFGKGIWSEPLELAPGAPPISDAVLTGRGPSCANCERLEREIAYLKAELEGVTKTPSIMVTGVTENTGNVTKTPRGRPNSGNALTPAQKQKAYRERHASAR